MVYPNCEGKKGSLHWSEVAEPDMIYQGVIGFRNLRGEEGSLNCHEVAEPDTIY